MTIMEFIHSFKERQASSRQKDIMLQAQRDVYLDDFDGKIFITFNNVPFIPIEDSWTQKQIIEKLEETRNSYVKYKIKQYG